MAALGRDSQINDHKTSLRVNSANDKSSKTLFTHKHNKCGNVSMCVYIPIYLLFLAAHQTTNSGYIPALLYRIETL